MKKRLLYLFLLLLSITTLSAQSRKVALLIGVGRFPDGSGWRSLHTANDLKLLREALEKQGVSVTTLADDQATLEGIRAALGNLTAHTKPGDQIMLHFSGHGQQLPDDDVNDEFDRMDEALIPFDAPEASTTANYDGSRHLRDDELDTCLRQLREKAGPTGQVFVSLDACHSGTGTRGLGPARGMAAAEEAPETSSSGTDFTPDQPEQPDPKWAPMVVFSASEPQQLNYEYYVPEVGQYYGPLSLALAHCLPRAGAEGLSYSDLFDLVRKEMAATAPRQTPVMEGAMGISIWSGNNKKAQKAFPGFDLTYWDDRNAYMEAGLLSQLYPGTRLEIVGPADRKLTTATITFSEPLRATLRLDAPLNKTTLSTAKARVTAQNFGPLGADVLVSLPNMPKLSAELSGQMTEYPALHPAKPDHFDLMVEETSTGMVRVTTYTGQVLVETPASEAAFSDAAYLIGEIIQPYMQARFLRRLEYAEPFLSVQLEILPVNAPAAHNQQPILHAGEEFTMRVTNTGERDCYFSILDIRPDHTLNTAIPREKEDVPTNYFLRAGASQVLPERWKATEPLGLEFLKVIATTDPVDLRQILRNRGDNTEEDQAIAPGAFKQIFIETFLPEEHRGGQTSNLDAGAVSISTVVMEVVK